MAPEAALWVSFEADQWIGHPLLFMKIAARFCTKRVAYVPICRLGAHPFALESLFTKELIKIRIKIS